MTSPRLSIVIPAYNEERGLTACVAALRRQTRDDFEIVVVDNNSTDGTAALAADLGTRVVPCSIQGIGSARNEGARQARGELVAFIDADGLPCERWVELALQRFDRDGRLDTVSGLIVFDAPGPLSYLFYNAYNVIAFSVLAAATLVQQHMVSGNNMVIKRDLFLQTPGFPPRICEDVHFAKGLRKRGGVRSGWEPRMRIVYSSRRFRRNGFVTTLLTWGRAVVVEHPEDEYHTDFR